jgi:hypothetical protein
LQSRYGRLCFSVAFALLLTATAAGQTARSADGIAVGEPKLFDNRSLTLMLENLKQALAGISGSTVDPKALKDSMELLQGYQQTDVSRSLDISTTGAKNAATLPAAPASTVPALGNKAGVSASDVLTDEVDLTYQIVNLQMVLDRAESDRYWSHTSTGAGTRTQAVLGFQVSVNPPPKYRGCAAVVEITVTVPGAVSPGDVSLVALMPQEKTYNAATLATHANTFSGAAVVKIVTVGYSESHRGSNLYLYKDSDTVAFERPQDGPGADTFGWQFRPVLGRPSVDAGVRQMFAVVALPNNDLYAPDPVNGQTPAAAPQLNVTAKTYWVKYDAKRRITGESQLGKQSGGYKDRPFTAWPGGFINKELGPTIKAVSWHPVGPDAALVDVQGDNLFEGSSILIGGAVIDHKSPALVQNSDQHLQLLTTVGVLAHSEGVVSGRYGIPAPLMLGNYLSPTQLAEKKLPLTEEVLQDWCSTNKDLLGRGLVIGGLNSYSYPGESMTTVEIDLVSRGKGDTVPPELCNQAPLVTVGDLTIPAVDDHLYGTSTVPELDAKGDMQLVPKKSLKLVVKVPTEQLAKEQFISVKVPFLGMTYANTKALYPPSSVGKLAQTSEGEFVTFAITGTEFSKDNTSVYADRKYTAADQDEVTLLGSTLLLLKLPKDKLKGVKQLIVMNGHEPVLLPLSGEAAKAPKPALVTQHLTAQQNSAVGLKIEGTNLKSIVKVTFEGKALDISKSEDGKSVTVYLTREVTKNAGATLDLLVYADADTILPAPVQIVKTAPVVAKK